MTKGKISK